MNTSNVHPLHQLPGEYKYGDILLCSAIPKETVDELSQGKGPDYDVLLVTFPRTGEN
jgi:hypothetical protein